MGNGEFFAGLGIFVAVGAGIGIAQETHDNAVDREKVKAAEYCLSTYASYDGGLGESTIKCLEQGWVAGRKVDDTGLGKDSPTELLKGYIEVKKEAADFNPTRAITFGMFSLGLAGFLYPTSDSRPPREFEEAAD